jgi:hypothetical protein
MCLYAFSLLLKGQCNEIAGGKFAAYIVDIDSKLLPVSTTLAVPPVTLIPVAYLPPVSLTPVAN